uniref:Biotin carboxyl carrier protein of acetyl-CoA carboxylase n=1 Tax=Izziella formosana TaxID=1653389 RepID=A0A1G4NUQ1_9FLOR|nr:Acetyl-CoA carboxylase, biotin carboxyl carrier protein [Izziella formosana]SCW22398.1 Acetyl-CoA carboxylase, biotin carboxyl carrier protein [Izziella formosana]
MQFNLTDLKELLSCLKNNNIQSLNVIQNNFELTVNKELVEKNKNTLIPTKSSKRSIKQVQQQKIVEKKVVNNTNKNFGQAIKEAELYFTIVSPMVGTFYRSPAPNEPFFIELNDNVTLNQTVCIVEAMKLMNEIEAEVSGTIMEILVEDGDIVDCGQPLMKIKPS